MISISIPVKQLHSLMMHAISTEGYYGTQLIDLTQND
jgi:hypothetical protein